MTNNKLPNSVMARRLVTRAVLLLCGLITLVMMGLALRDAFSKGHQEVITLSNEKAKTQRPQVNQTGVNLNTATKEELMSLPGIGEYLAEQIVLKRGEQPFYFIEDLGAVKGFGEKRIAALKPLAYVPLPIDLLAVVSLPDDPLAVEAAD